MAGRGYVKLYRSLVSHWVFTDAAMFYLWTNLLMRANWKPGKFWPGGGSGPIDVERGQLVTGRNSLHTLLYPSHDKHGRAIKRESPPPHATTLWRWLGAMQKDGMIALDVRSKYTIVTICNYDTYQRNDSDDAQGDAQDVRKWCADDAPMVRKSCADGAQVVRTIEEEQEHKEGEEGKKVKNGKHTPKPPRGMSAEVAALFETFWREFPSGRKQGKELARKSFAAALKKTTAQAIIEAAMEYAASPVGRGEYVKGPAAWLNQGCWADDRAAWNRSSGGQGKPLFDPDDPTGNMAVARRYLEARNGEDD
jgi:hypothetical protein